MAVNCDDGHSYGPSGSCIDCGRSDKTRYLHEPSKDLKDSDPVSDPQHYTRGAIEAKDAIASAVAGYDGFEAYALGNVIKYIWRGPYKGSQKQDLDKAMEYLKMVVGDV